MKNVATNAQYITSYRFINARLTSTNHVVGNIEILKENEQWTELKIKQGRNDYQDANNHSTKLHLVTSISEATSRLLSN